MDTNALAVAYTDRGIGVPVIFLHAFPLNRTMWMGQIETLLDEQRFRLVAPDWPGFGESKLTNAVSTMDEFAANLAALTDALGMQRVILCGLSMGGYVAFAFLRAYRQRVAGLILADTKPTADDEAGKANRENVAQLAESQGSDAIADSQIPKLLSDYTRQHHPDVESRVRQMIASATPRGIAAAARGMALRSDATDLLPTITFPTLVLTGEQDALTPPEVARTYAEHIPNAQFIVIPRAGHLSNLEQPEAFLAQIRSFLLSGF